MSVSTYLLSFASGDYETALDVNKLQELPILEVRDNAAKIMKLLTKAVCDGAINNAKYNNSIFQLTSQLLSSIQCNASNTDIAIISCIYYLSKHFLKQGCLELALKLKPFVMSMKFELKENVINSIYALFYEFYSFLKEHKDICSDRKFQIQLECLEILSLCKIKYLHLFLTELDVIIYSVDKSTNNLQKVLNLLSLANKILKENVIEEQCEVICKLYVQCSSNILNFKLQAWEQISEYINVFETSSATCNTLISFFVTSLKSFFKFPLPHCIIEKQISLLKSFLESKPNFLHKYVCSRLSRVFLCIHSNWLKTLTDSLSFKDFLVVSEMGILLSVFSTRNLDKNVEQDLFYMDGLRGIITLISLAHNAILSRMEPKEKENCKTNEDIFKFFESLLKVQTQCYKLVSILKNSNISLWKENWKGLASRSYNLALITARRGYHDIALYLYQNLCCTFLMLEQTEELNMLICPLDVIIGAFRGLCQCFMNQLKPKEALITISIAVLLLPDKCKSLQKNWMFLKNNEGSSLQKFTMYNIIQGINSNFKTVFPESSMKIEMKINKSKINDLLKWELESYLINRGEMCDSICEVGKILMQHPHDSVTYVEALVLATSCLWMRSENFGSEAFQHLCEMGLQILKNLNQESDWQTLYLIGSIHFYKFCAEITILRKKLNGDVKSMKDKVHNGEKRSVMKGIIDPSEAEIKSNIIMVYSDLNIAKEQEHLKLLFQAIETWNKILKTDLSASNSTHDNFKSLLINIKTIATFFALYGYYVHSLRVWNTYYLLCKKMDDKVGILYALSHLLTFSGYKTENKFWSEAEKIEEEIMNMGSATEQKEVVDLQKEVLMTFWFTKCNSCLLNKQFEIGWQYLLKMNSVNLATIMGYVYNARRKILLSKYLVSCPYPSKTPECFKGGNSFLAIGEALGILKFLFLRKDLDPLYETCCLHLVKIEASEWMGDIFLGVKLYRDCHAYLKDDLFLAQTLGLASRVSQIVSKLAQIDLLCSEIENLQVKLFGMEAILGLNTASETSNYLKYNEEGNEEDVKSTVVDAVDVKFLDVPTRYPSTNIGSPILKLSPFKSPYIANHEEKCFCLSCCSTLVQSLFVDVTYFKTQVLVHNGESELALSFFKGGLNLAKHFIKRQEKLVLELSKSIFLDTKVPCLSFSNELSTSLSRFSMFYKEFSLSTSKFKQIEEVSAYLSSRASSSECHPYFILDVIDRTCVVNAENSLHGKLKGQQPKKCDLDESLELNSKFTSQSLMLTPDSSHVNISHAPPRNQREDHKFFSQVASPSLVVNLETRLKEEKRIDGKHRKVVSVQENREIKDFHYGDLSLDTIDALCEFGIKLPSGEKATVPTIHLSSDDDIDSDVIYSFSEENKILEKSSESPMDFEMSEKIFKNKGNHDKSYASNSKCKSVVDTGKRTYSNKKVEQILCKGLEEINLDDPDISVADTTVKSSNRKTVKKLHKLNSENVGKSGASKISSKLKKEVNTLSEVDENSESTISTRKTRHTSRQTRQKKCSVLKETPSNCITQPSSHEDMNSLKDQEVEELTCTLQPVEENEDDYLEKALKKTPKRRTRRRKCPFILE